MSKNELKHTMQYSLFGLSLALGITGLVEMSKSTGFVLQKEQVSISTEKNQDTVVNDQEGKSIENKKEIPYIENSEELDQYIPNKPTFSDIRKALENNKNLSDQDRKQILKVVDKMEEMIPFIDTRAFYENCLQLKVTRDMSIDNDHTAGSFSPSEKIINLKSKKKRVFRHETSHMTNCLEFYDSEGYYRIREFCGTGEHRFLEEGLTEWLNQYLFSDYKDSSYKVEVRDVKLFQFICQFTDDDLVRIYNQGNCSDIMSKLNISDDEKEELARICEKSKDFLCGDVEEDITNSEAIKKYEILLKAALNSRKGQELSSYICELNGLLYDSYCYYPNSVEIASMISDQILGTSSSKNSIIIENQGQQSINYLDFDNLYFICSDAMGDSVISEKISYNGKDQYYIDKDVFNERCVNITLSYDNNAEMISISELIDEYGDDRKHYTYDDICSMYKKSKHKDKKVKEKTR